MMEEKRDQNKVKDIQKTSSKMTVVKFFIYSNYFKCNQIKVYNQKEEIDKMDLKTCPIHTVYND